jgi:hypothetical protein
MPEVPRRTDSPICQVTLPEGNLTGDVEIGALAPFAARRPTDFVGAGSWQAARVAVSWSDRSNASISLPTAACAARLAARIVATPSPTPSSAPGSTPAA